MFPEQAECWPGLGQEAGQGRVVTEASAVGGDRGTVQAQAADARDGQQCAGAIAAAGWHQGPGYCRVGMPPCPSRSSDDKARWVPAGWGRAYG
jgi:hypothetical protein